MGGRRAGGRGSAWSLPAGHPGQGQRPRGRAGRMRLSKTLVDMDMADYSAALDPAYTTLEFENVQVLTMGNGRWGQVCPGTGAGLWRSILGWEENDRKWQVVLTGEYRCCQVKQICPGTVTRGILGEGRPARANLQQK